MGSQNLKNTQDTNVAVHTVSNIMKNMMGSDADSEVGALFHNDQEAEPICTILHGVVHPQPEKTMKTYNYITNSIANNTVRQKNVYTFLLDSR